MKVKEKISMLLLPIIVFLAWSCWNLIEFASAISSPEERMQPEIQHPKNSIDYIFDALFYSLLLVALYLLWRIVKANLLQRDEK